MDPANILSILASLGGQDPSAAPPPAPVAAPQTNVLQAAAPPPPAPPPPDPASQVVDAANAASPPMPRKKHSLADIIGRIADSVATVGGSTPMYQPTIDAENARETAASDHARKVLADNLALETNKFDLSDKKTTAANSERDRFANVLDAINDPEDAANMPGMLQAAGLTDPKYAPFVAMVQKDPGQAKVLASALGAGSDDKLGHNLYFGTGPDGKTVAYQIGDDGKPHILDFNGVTPGENVKVVNLGGKTALVGGSTGTVKKILPNSVSPNTTANNQTSTGNNIRTTTTALTIAGMPARAGVGKDGAGGKGDPQSALDTLANIKSGFGDLHNLKALPGDGGDALGQVEGALGRTALGQRIGEQAGSPAAQKRLELVKNINTLQSQMIQSLPGSATRTKFEQEIQRARLPDPAKMSYSTAMTVIGQLETSYRKALAGAARETKGKPAAGGGSNLPMLTPEQARNLPSGTPFMGTDGVPRVRH